MHFCCSPNPAEPAGHKAGDLRTKLSVLGDCIFILSGVHGQGALGRLRLKCSQLLAAQET